MAISKSVYKSFLVLSNTLLFTPLNAEKSGVFLEGGFIYSNFESIEKESRGPETLKNIALAPILVPGTATMQKSNGDLYGADIMLGYKHFFGAKKHLGLRYYAIFSGQGGSIWQNQSSTLGYTQPAANLFYGVGMDFLFNLYQKNEHSFGVFIGAMVGGSSWLMGKSGQFGQCRFSYLGTCTTMNAYYSQLAQQQIKGTTANFSPTFVQFIFDLGFRAQLSRHNGIELGVHIPTIDDPYQLRRKVIALAKRIKAFFVL
ncbi:outer membrane protein [Helicobacter suis]|uniref:outer membrane protein n=1 Tax=Helicobacter suis TaxID=104628 RepID=UPI0013D12CCE|nr:outer membrane protein [Helicobacter suis]